MKRITKYLLATSMGVAGGLFMATRVFSKYKNQSLSSWSIEKGLFVYGMKQEQQSLFEHQERIDEFIDWNTRNQKRPDILVGHRVEETFYGPMQVFSWNKQAKKQAVIFYLHGGGYAFPPYPTHYLFLRSIVRKTKARVIFPVYLKTPKYSYQQSIPYVLSLYKEMLKTNKEIGPIILMGDSSGGGMALGLADALRQEGIKQPAEIIVMSPWLDITSNNPDIPEYEPKDPMMSKVGLDLASDYWLGNIGDNADPLVSPIQINGEGLGHISLFVGTHEMFYPDIIRFADKLEEQTIPHNLYVGEKMNHMYPLFPTPEANKARKIIAEVINNALKKF